MGHKFEMSAQGEQDAAIAREIHHRIKNNLQIVASVINLYSRGIGDPYAKLAFRQIQARVDALALIQRLVERSASGQTVDMQTLLAQLTDQIRGMATGCRKDFEIALDIDACELSADIATPLALFAVEGLSFGLFEEECDSASSKGALWFKARGRQIDMRIENPSLVTRRLEDGSPSPAKLLSALADQLRATWTLDGGRAEGCGLVLCMSGNSAGTVA